MELPLVTREDLEKAKEEIISKVTESLNEAFLKSREEEYLTTEEVCKILNVCAKQFKKYRDDRRISYTRFGRKIYVKRSDLNAFMEEYRIKRRQWH